MALMHFIFMLQTSLGTGGSTDYTPQFDFTDDRNSQYIALI